MYISRGLVAMQLRTAGWAAGRSGEGVKFTGCVSWRASPILGGSRHKSDRIFIDAKLAISSPVTIPELCISLGDSRSEVYPSRLFPPRSPTRSALFHAESFLPFPSSPSSPSSSATSSCSSTSSPLLLSLPLRFLLLRNPLANIARLVSLAELPPPFGLPTLRTLSRLETSLIGRARGWKKRRYPRIRPITVNARDNARDILHR